MQAEKKIPNEETAKFDFYNTGVIGYTIGLKK